MGVRGLTTFIATNSKRYLKPIILRDSKLVVDGNCIASHLYKWCTRRDSAFGGDYDEFYAIVKRFFTLLRKCNIIPIVIMDGGYESKKIATVMERLRTKLFTLKTSFGSYSRTKFFPLFMKLVFCEAVESCGVTLIQTEFEADCEIAVIARQLECPVMSYDSDFFIYDVLYIPFDTVHLEVDTKDAMGLSCSMYNVEDFLNEYSGLKKGHLPFLAIALGNDYVEKHVFQNFFNQIPLPKAKHASNPNASERKIIGLLKWLRHESEESAVSKMLQHISKKDRHTILENLAAAKENYSATGAKSKINLENERVNIICTESALSVSNEIKNLLWNGRLPSFIIDMTCIQTYFTQLQIEDVKEPSAHLNSIPLITAIYSLIFSGRENPPKLKLYIRDKLRLICETIPALPSDSTLDQLRQASFSSRRKFVFDSLSLKEEDVVIIDGILDECQMFLSCLITWSLSQKASAYHMHSLLLSYLSSQALNKVGLFRSVSVNAEELKKFTSMFISMRKTTDNARSSFSSSVLHVFSMFQSILYHATILNVMLGLPIKPCKVTDSFSGTLAYNVFLDIVSRSEVLQYIISHFLQPTATVAEMYEEFYNKLEKFFPNVTNVADKRQRKRKKKRSVVKEVSNTQSTTDDDECQSYVDVNNKFSTLMLI